MHLDGARRQRLRPAVRSAAVTNARRVWRLWMLIRRSEDSNVGAARIACDSRKPRANGFTLLELLLVIAVGMILTAVAIPVIGTTMNNMRMNSVVNAISSAVSKTRYESIMVSQPYTLVLTAPANTYVVTNTSTAFASPVTPLPSQLVQINGGAAATYTFTFCPNGTVYGAGAVCNPPAGAAPPAISVTSQGRQINVTVSGVGNVTTTTIQ
jgi:prepilin-type N-terminal cleavage/methylation domain-containing protein